MQMDILNDTVAYHILLHKTSNKYISANIFITEFSFNLSHIYYSVSAIVNTVVLIINLIGIHHHQITINILFISVLYLRGHQDSIWIRTPST
jgi:hypothetical protein